MAEYSGRPKFHHINTHCGLRQVIPHLPSQIVYGSRQKFHHLTTLLEATTFGTLSTMEALIQLLECACA
ncbi:hypothetical protein HKD37_20G055378 [Glycine soja]